MPARVHCGMGQAAGPGPAFDFAVNYRLTPGFPTTADAPNAVVCADFGIVYPSLETNGNGLSVICGWAIIGNSAAQDLVAGIDPRLSGNNYGFGGGNACAFDFELPAGNYVIYCAQGADDRGSGDDYDYRWYDFTNSGPDIFNHAATSKPGNGWTDANGDFYTSAAWLATNGGAGGGTGIPFTVIANDDRWRFEINTLGRNFTRLAHVNIVSV